MKPTIIKNTTVVDVYVNIAKRHNEVSLVSNDTSSIILHINGVYIILFQKGDNVYMFGTKKLIKVDYEDGDIKISEKEQEQKQQQEQKQEQKQKQEKKQQEQKQQQEQQQEEQQQQKQQQEQKQEQQQQQKKQKQGQKYEFLFYSLDIVVFKTKYGLGIRDRKSTDLIGWINSKNGKYSLFVEKTGWKHKELVKKIKEKISIIVYQARKEGLLKPVVISASYEYKNGKFRVRKKL